MEEEFQRRMHDAEASPSADLWSRIDHQLTVQENGQYKRGMLFYRQLAAACVTLLIVAGGLAVYYLQGAAPAPLAHVQPGQSAAAAVASAGMAAATAEERPVTDEAIAAAMQEAVQQPVVVRRPAQAAKPKLAKKSASGSAQTGATPATIAGAEEAFVADAASAVATEPGAWHAVPGATYTASFGSNGGKQASQRVLSMFPSAREALTGMPVKAGFSAAPPAFAATKQAGEAAADFRSLNEAVMHRVKEVQAEQEQMLQRYKAEQALAVAGKTEKEERSGSAGKWSLGMAYTPSYFEQNIGMPTQMMGPSSFKTLMPPSAIQESTAMVEEAREEYEQEVEPGFSFGVEVKAGFKLGKKWKLLSGLGFTQNTARSKSSYVIQQFWNKPNSEERVSPGPTTIFLPSLSSNFASDSLNVTKAEEFNVQYRYRHLTVPVGVQYEGQLSKDWFWFAGGGVAANILLQTSILASASDVNDIDYGVSDDNSPFRKLQWSGNVTAGLGKRLSNNLSVTIGPEFRGYFDTLLSSPEKAHAPQGKPYTMGLNMAVNYDLGPGRR